MVPLHWGEEDKNSAKDFLTGFEAQGDVIGSPVDIVQDQSGVFYVSDDYAGTIYRVEYSGK